MDTKTSLLRRAVSSFIILAAVLGIILAGTTALNLVSPVRIAAVPDGTVSDAAPGTLMIAYATDAELERGQVVLLPDAGDITIGRVADFLERDTSSYTLTVRADDGSAPVSYLYRSADSIYSVVASIPFAGYLLSFATSIFGLIFGIAFILFAVCFYLFGLHRRKTVEEREDAKVGRARQKANDRIRMQREASGLKQMRELFEEKTV